MIFLLKPLVFPKCWLFQIGTQQFGLKKSWTWRLRWRGVHRDSQLCHWSCGSIHHLRKVNFMLEKKKKKKNAKNDKNQAISWISHTVYSTCMLQNKDSESLDRKITYPGQQNNVWKVLVVSICSKLPWICFSDTWEKHPSKWCLYSGKITIQQYKIEKNK